MSKESCIESLRIRYPDEPAEVLELAWRFHSMEKAKKYIAMLETCNSNADVAWKVVRLMYISGDIDEVLVTQESFLSTLLPFTSLPKESKAHSVAHHTRNMLRDKEVIAMRKEFKAAWMKQHLARLHPEVPRIADVTIQIQFRTSDEKIIRHLMQLASQCDGVVVKVEGRKDDSILPGSFACCDEEGGKSVSDSAPASEAFPVSDDWDADDLSYDMSSGYEADCCGSMFEAEYDDDDCLEANWCMMCFEDAADDFRHSAASELYQFECSAANIPVAIPLLCDFFSEENPEVSFVSYNNKVLGHLPLRDFFRQQPASDNDEDDIHF